MGEVFEVEHRQLKKRVVAKLLRPELANDPGFVDRMRVEAQALAALSHPNLVSVMDLGQSADGRPYFIMERLEGNTLTQELRQHGALPAPVVVRYVRELLSALGAAHALGVVHRDIKLDNLFLHRPPGALTQLKVLDFGVAKILQSAASNAPLPPVLATTAGVVVGTPRFVSPEQALGQPIDARSDLYAVGLVLYTLLAGRGPFDDVPRQQLVVAHIQRRADVPSRYAPGFVSQRLDAIVMKALQKRPEDRFDTAEQFEAALGTVAREYEQFPHSLPTGVIGADTLAALRARARAPDPTAAPLTPDVSPDPFPTPSVEIGDDDATLIDAPPWAHSSAITTAPLLRTTAQRSRVMLPTEVLPELSSRPTGIAELTTHTARPLPDLREPRVRRRFSSDFRVLFRQPNALHLRYGLALCAGVLFASLGLYCIPPAASAWAFVAVAVGAAIAATLTALLLNRQILRI
jgi:serine/threonine-protein kinase